MTPKPRIAILISGRGTNMKALAEACADGRLQADIDIVVSDRDGIEGLQIAHALGIHTEVIDYDGLDRKRAEEALTRLLTDRCVEWVVLAGFMRILSPVFINTFMDKTVNIHPSLLPAFPGMAAIKKAYDYGVKVTGVTVHLVDVKVDHGPILAQMAVPVLDEDTLGALEERVHAVEHDLYWRTLAALFEGRFAASEAFSSRGSGGRRRMLHGKA